MVPLFIDHDLTDVISGALAAQYPEVDMVHAEDVGLAAADDEVLLEWAADHGRVLVTSDASTMIDAAYQRLRQGKPMPGLVVVRQSLPFRIAIEDLAAIALCSEPSEWESKVTFLPLNQ
jgi:predicted nuclease of predicted toxin-antitoxin system